MEDTEAVKLFEGFCDLNTHLTSTINAQNVVFRREDVPEGSIEEFLHDDRLISFFMHVINSGSASTDIFSSLDLSENSGLN